MKGKRERADQLAFWLVVGIILIGAFLRFYQLVHVPISSGYDPAYYGLDALDILDGELPIYLATNYGREALFSYLVAAVYAGIGLSDFGIHLASAIVGILTIPMNYVVAGELLRFSDSRLVRRLGPILAAAVLAISYWHVVWSRYGVRAILAPFFVSLTVFLLLRAMRTGDRNYFFVAGLATSASLYTYQIGQLVPVLVLAIVLIDWWSRRNRVRLSLYLRSLAWLAIPLLVVALPLVSYAWQHPLAFNHRVRDVAVLEVESPLAEQAGALSERLLILLRFFTVEGDTHGMWSVGRLPGLNVVLVAGSMIGLLALIWSWRRPLAQVGLAWLLLMLTPAVLAGFGAVSKRAMGALPLITTMIAYGFLIVATFVRGRSPNGRFRPAAAMLVIGAGLAFTFFHTYQQYFVVWANDRAKDGEFDPHISEMGVYIASLPEETQVYLSADAPNHPNMLLHSRLKTASDDVRGYNGWHCFVYPQSTTRPTAYVLSEESSVNRLQEAYPAGALQTTGLSNAYGYEDYYVAYHIPPGEVAITGPQHTVNASWSDQIALLGYDLQDSAVAPGEQLQLTLYWSSLHEMETRYTAFVHLIGEENPATGNPLWGQSDSEPCLGFYPTAVWREGEIIRDEINLDVSPDAQPGRYKLAVGFYTWPDIQRLPIADMDSYTLQEIAIGSEQAGK